MARHHRDSRKIELIEDRNEELLAYIPEYGVLICRTCQFAIQPSALSNHLLRHRLYRNHRRRILEYISTLKLLEPEDVPIPPTDTNSFLHLPVYKGYRCNADGCEHACISQKRMSQHWSEKHLEPDSRQVDARSVCLQTFFRGNRIRYFEVSECSHTLMPDARVESASEHGSTVPGSVQPSTQSVLDNKTYFECSESIKHEINMPALKYFHHFITSTSFTVSRSSASSKFWTETIPQEALQHEFLMFGTLAVAAYHSASLTTECTTAQMHQQMAIGYHTAGLKGFRLAMLEPTSRNSRALVAFSWLLGIQRCAQTHIDFEESSSSANETDSRSAAYAVQTINLLRGGCEILATLQGVFSEDVPLVPVEEHVMQGQQYLTPDELIVMGPHPYLVRDALAVLEGSKVFKQSISRVGDFIGDADFIKLCSMALTVPTEHITAPWVQSGTPGWQIGESYSRFLAETLRDCIPRVVALHKADHTKGLLPPPPPRSRFPNLPEPLYKQIISLRDYFAALSMPQADDLEAIAVAINALLFSFSRSRNGNGRAAIWNGIETWACALPSHFMRMLGAGREEALVVFAHWCLLVKELEGEHWFLRGKPRQLLEIAASYVSGQLEVLVRDLRLQALL